MSSSPRLPIGVIDAALDEIFGVDPIFLTTSEKQAALVDLSRVLVRVEAARLRVLAVADDVAEATGDRSTAQWLAGARRESPSGLRRLSRLASGLRRQWLMVEQALAAGSVSLTQAWVIVEALDALPDGERGLVGRAEEFLLAQAADLGPGELRVLGGRVLEFLAPEVADRVEYRRLLAEEQRARAATRLTLRDRGDGSSDLHARIPSPAAGRLRSFLDAYTSPRRAGPGEEVASLPMARQRGEALVTLLENIPTHRLPRHGGTATTVMITVDHTTLLEELESTGALGVVAVASTSTGHRITAGQARRLACQAGILPAVLGGHSEVLDVGRTRRLVTETIRKALNLRDRGCTAQGCSMPASFCEAHHTIAWSHGGPTSLANTKLLCSFHHHRAHDPTWHTTHHPHGTTTFHRRT